MSKKRRVHVSEFLRPDITTEVLFQGLKTNLTVVFDDGELELTSREITFNSIVWEIFKVLPEIKICIRHSITSYYKGGFFNADSLKQLMEVIFKDVVDHYVWPNKDREILNTFLYEKFQIIYNDIYNKIICNAQEYSISIDVTDFTEVQCDTRILDKMLTVKREKTNESIKDAYDTIKEVLGTDPKYFHNPVSVGYRSGSFNTNQLVQILGPKGFGTEIDFSIFKEPVCNSFTLGLQTVYESILESRASARAIYLSTVAIEQSEYFARMLQLISMRVERLVDGDCGSTEYREVVIDKESLIGKDELKYYVGKVYLDEETNTLKTITKEDTHLYGKKLKIRSPIYCKHPNPKCICMTCFGKLSVNVPYKTNLGHLCTTTISRDVSQKILSNKHHISTALAMKLELGDFEQKWFKVKDGSILTLNQKSYSNKNYKYELSIPQYTAKGLLGLSRGTNLDNIIANKISKLDEAMMLVTDKKGNCNFYPLVLSQSKSILKKKRSSKSSKIHGFFTNEFIKYIVNGGNYRYRIDNETNNIVIDLSEWKGNQGVIEYISLEYNFLELTKEMKSTVRTLNGENKTPEYFIQELFNLLNVKLDINIALIEVMALCFIIRSKEHSDVRLAKGDEGKLVKLPTILYNGSVAGINLFEGHDRYLFSPPTFRKDLPDHPTDILFDPERVLDLVHQGLRN